MRVVGGVSTPHPLSEWTDLRSHGNPLQAGLDLMQAFPLARGLHEFLPAGMEPTVGSALI